MVDFKMQLLDNRGMEAQRSSSCPAASLWFWKPQAWRVDASARFRRGLRSSSPIWRGRRLQAYPIRPGRGVSVVRLADPDPDMPGRSTPLRAHLFLAPDACTQQRIVDCGCHPRARKKGSEFGGLHFSIDVRSLCLQVRGGLRADPEDSNRFRIRSPKDWRTAVGIVRRLAKAVSDKEWRAFITTCDIMIAGVDKREIRNEQTRARVIYFGRRHGDKFTAINPLQKHVNLLPHFSLYGRHALETLCDKHDFGTLHLSAAWKVVDELRNVETRWSFVMAVESEEALEYGLQKAFVFHWGMELA